MKDHLLLIYLFGIALYFLPLRFPAAYATGLVIAGIGVFANALSAILGRDIKRSKQTDPILVTTVSMGSGALVLFLAGITFQGLPSLSLRSWVIVIWLAAINTAFAFTLWNHTLRDLSAMESSVINNTMLIQISMLAWVFLGERLTGLEILGIGLAAIGTLIVQVSRPP